MTSYSRQDSEDNGDYCSAGPQNTAAGFAIENIAHLSEHLSRRACRSRPGQSRRGRESSVRIARIVLSRRSLSDAFSKCSQAP